jgi:hypothetical protein
MEKQESVWSYLSEEREKIFFASKSVMSIDSRLDLLTVPSLWAAGMG